MKTRWMSSRKCTGTGGEAGEEEEAGEAEETEAEEAEYPSAARCRVRALLVLARISGLSWIWCPSSMLPFTCFGGCSRNRKGWSTRRPDDSIFLLIEWASFRSR